MEKFNVYKDINARTNGEIYLGVVGPVRTGKSTFIKRFMDVMVLPKMADGSVRERAKDELPQSASGKMVMTAEPKFVPKEAAEIKLNDVAVKVRLIDCVGYMVDGATGHLENGEERKVKTPWFDQEIPFTKAASVGTKKVIKDHATIGIVITTDGSIGELKRENYLEAEKNTIEELKALDKPFVVLVNSVKPYGQNAENTVNYLKEKYDVSPIAVNCEQLKEEDIYRIMEKVLFEFPISEIEFYIPKWMDVVPQNHKMKKNVIDYIKDLLERLSEIKDVSEGLSVPNDTCIKQARVEQISLDSGKVKIEIQMKEACYYAFMSEFVGEDIHNEYELVCFMKEMAQVKQEYEGAKDAFESVKCKGYGVVSPKIEEIVIDEPVIIKQGNKFGVKIHSQAPSIHMIRANIETEIAPIVGSEEQANDLIAYIKNKSDSEQGIWNTNIFGKSIEELVKDGIKNKLAMINDESQMKLQDTMQKIVNDTNGGMVCIII